MKRSADMTAFKDVGAALHDRLSWLFVIFCQEKSKCNARIQI